MSPKTNKKGQVKICLHDLGDCIVSYTTKYVHRSPPVLEYGFGGIRARKEALTLGGVLTTFNVVPHGKLARPFFRNGSRSIRKESGVSKFLSQKCQIAVKFTV